MDEKKHDVERGSPLLSASRAMKDKQTSSFKLIIWIAINVLATTGIVYVNKSIFTDPDFKRCPSSFVAFHFAITGLTLHFVSRPQIGVFTAAPTSVVSVLPLTVMMCANVVLVNLSLSYSSIVVYQIIRILLTPLTAAINFFFYGARLPLTALISLIPACVGVGLVSYNDSLLAAATNSKKGSTIGVVFALSGVVTSSVYTVWVSQYHKTLQMNSMQLLYNQIPVGVALLAGISLFTDKFPDWTTVRMEQWMMIFASGFFACLVNLSQFSIINSAGPVSGTVVGHLKTCLIVGLGWVTAKKVVGAGSVTGILLAISGMILYSVAMLRNVAKVGR